MNTCFCFNKITKEKLLILNINFLMNALLEKLKRKVKMSQCSNFIDILQLDY